ncbi:MAG: hypothetical protein P1V20_25640 [Verrucomicrobiales bacterium]|nr:hypothetical protein [Verrucomicrobiales bacterium]
MNHMLFLSIGISFLFLADIAGQKLAGEPSQKARDMVFPQFQLNDSGLKDAVEAWKEATKAAHPKNYGFYPTISGTTYTFDDVKISLTLSGVKATGALETIISEFNKKATRYILVIEWNDNNVKVQSESTSRGRGKALSIQLPRFEIENQTFIDAVKHWSRLVKIEDPKKDGLAWTATHLRDKFALSERFTLTIEPTSALDSLERICKAANASVVWEQTSFDGRTYDACIIQNEHKAELKTIYTWTSSDESKSLKGRFMRLDNGIVQIHAEESNRAISISLENLNEESQKLATKLSELKR